jgi:diadenosine tetraphosphate (Ap4A) HIT family hydrolase
MTLTEFALDPRLRDDTHCVADLALSRLLLMDDSRYPWLILVPRRAGVSELTDLTIGDQALLLSEINRASALVRRLQPVDRINVGMLGNVVPQLHAHIVGRQAGDDAWPGPVWGHGSAQRYAGEALQTQLDRLQALLSGAPAPLDTDAHARRPLR